MLENTGALLLEGDSSGCLAVNAAPEDAPSFLDTFEDNLTSTPSPVVENLTSCSRSPVVENLTSCSRSTRVEREPPAGPAQAFPYPSTPSPPQWRGGRG